MRRILFITQHAPPRPGAGARRIHHQLVSARRTYDSVHVLHGDRGHGPCLVRGVTAHPINLRDVRQLYRSKSNEHTVPSTSIWKKYLGRFRQAFPFVLLTDDGGYFYRREAYTIAASIIEEEEITHLFSSFRPWSDHLVARRLKNQFPNLTWTADFRDLPVDRVRRDVWFPKLQTWWGRRVIHKADTLKCVSFGQRRQLLTWHESIEVERSKLESLPPLTNLGDTCHFRFVYTGSIYPRLQSLLVFRDAILLLLATGELKIDELRISYRGPNATEFRTWCSGIPNQCLDIKGYVPPFQALELQRTATVLVLLTWSAESYGGVLTAKLFDYLAAGRPILCLVNGPQDEELEGIVEGCSAGLVLAGEVEVQLYTALQSWINEWRKGRGLPYQGNLKQLSNLL